MSLQKLDGQELAQMIKTGALHLANNAAKIDALNVFPVPDGDTGTNMNLSMTSGAKEAQQANTARICDVANAFAKGLLMGARGNSGVILSQIFRGFAKGLEGLTEADVKDLAKAFDAGVDTAYKAVMKPVEGTILTVAKDSAASAAKHAENISDVIAFMEAVTQDAKISLQRTPELLPVLKEVGVVDSGGQGLVTIYEGFLAALKGEPIAGTTEPVEIEELVKQEHHKIAQDFMDTADIQYGYCTEFMVKLETDKLQATPYDEQAFRETLSKQGDSLLVVSDDELIKVHVHTEYPGKAMTLGQQYGSLINIKVENMREQHTAIVGKQAKQVPAEKSAYAVVAIAAGRGVKQLFENLGAAVVLEGGQTMNPSTQDISEAIEKAHAERVIILPNNKNIMMAAEQAAELAETEASVVQALTIPQGISALLAFNPEADMNRNTSTMNAAANHVKTGQLTYAVRDTTIEGMPIKSGQFIGLHDGKITAADPDKKQAAVKLLKDILEDTDEILTIIYGEDSSLEEAEALAQIAEELVPEIEVELHEGNQPIYAFILAVE